MTKPQMAKRQVIRRQVRSPEPGSSLPAAKLWDMGTETEEIETEEEGDLFFGEILFLRRDSLERLSPAIGASWLGRGSQ